LKLTSGGCHRQDRQLCLGPAPAHLVHETRNRDVINIVMLLVFGNDLWNPHLQVGNFPTVNNTSLSLNNWQMDFIKAKQLPYPILSSKLSVKPKCK
jgi:hypothetical protein